MQFTINKNQEEWLRGLVSYMVAATLMVIVLTITLWAETGKDLIFLVSILGLLISTIIIYLISIRVEITPTEEKPPN